MKLDKISFVAPCDFLGISNTFTSSQGWEIEVVDGEVKMSHPSRPTVLVRDVGYFAVERTVAVVDPVAPTMPPTMQASVTPEPVREIPPPAATTAESPNAKRGRR